MKFVEPSHFTDPDAAVRKLLEIANATEPAQNGRLYIELVNAAQRRRWALWIAPGPLASACYAPSTPALERTGTTEAIHSN
jgi:hypothetical protein